MPKGKSGDYSPKQKKIAATDPGMKRAVLEMALHGRASSLEPLAGQPHKQALVQPRSGATPGNSKDAVLPRKGLHGELLILL